MTVVYLVCGLKGQSYRRLFKPPPPALQGRYPRPSGNETKRPPRFASRWHGRRGTSPLKKNYDRFNHTFHKL